MPSTHADKRASAPNIILINCDDLGYGDLGCYGSEVNRTPHLDRLAAEGMRFTDFYMASPVCSPSRGGMLTGCYPSRIGFDDFDGIPVLFPGQSKGLHRDEITMADLLQESGYATALVGKWHCGDQPEFLPTAHGFDHYFGLPYSNDMGRQALKGDGGFIRRFEQQLGTDYGIGENEEEANFPPLPLMKDGEVFQEQPDQAALTERYTAECIDFIRTNREHPFFLYFAQMYVHLPIYVPQPFLKQSANGRYGAAVEHIDWTVGVLRAELERLGLAEDTLILFTSDNGSRARGEGGSNGVLRGTKGSCWEGGQRVPLIAWWPRRIAAGVERGQWASALDFLPTLAGLAGAEVPADRKLDGRDLGPVLFGEEEPVRDEPFYYIHHGVVHGVRVGKWKLHVARKEENGFVAVQELYDLEKDVGETTNLAGAEPTVVERLGRLVEAVREDLGDRWLGIEGSGRRPVGEMRPNRPLTRFNPEHPYFAMEYDLADRG